MVNFLLLPIHVHKVQSEWVLSKHKKIWCFMGPMTSSNLPTSSCTISGVHNLQQMLISTHHLLLYCAIAILHLQAEIQTNTMICPLHNKDISALTPIGVHFTAVKMVAFQVSDNYNAQMRWVVWEKIAVVTPHRACEMEN